MKFAETLEDLLDNGDSRVLVGLMREQQRLKAKKAILAEKQALAQKSRLKAAQPKAAITHTQKAPLRQPVAPIQKSNASQPQKQLPQPKSGSSVPKSAPVAIASQLQTMHERQVAIAQAKLMKQQQE